MTTRTVKAADPRILKIPFVVVQDSRESAPWTFSGLQSDSDRGYRPLLIPLERKGLATGDYSISGLEHRIAIERKSVEDVVGTIAGRRKQFEAEHERMKTIVDAGGFAAVVVESDLSAFLTSPPIWSNMRAPAKTVYRTYLSWSIKYGVHWHWAGNRRLAEVTTFRLLEKCWENFGGELSGNTNEGEIVW